MIRPFEIVQTRQEPDGTGVIFRVQKRTVEGDVTRTKSLQGYVLVPDGQDIEQATYRYLKESGWVE